jgi:S1-C subfamily serine protease
LAGILLAFILLQLAMYRSLSVLALVLLLFSACVRYDLSAKPTAAQSESSPESTETVVEVAKPVVVDESAAEVVPTPAEIVAAAPEPPTPPTPEQLYAATAPAVVLLQAKGKDGADIAQGTGFFIDDAGTLVTNAHVVLAPGASFVIARVGNETSYLVEHVQSFDMPMDLAILKIPGQTPAHLPIADAMPNVGSRVFVVGNPVGLKHTLSEGLVSSLRRINNNHEVIQTTAAIGPGSSGSPLLNDRGQVIGVTTLTVTKGQNLNFAVPATAVQELLKKDRANHLVRFYSFMEKFKVDNASWMYAANGTVLTSQGQAFAAAIDSLKTKGISDPEQLAKEGLKVAGIQGTLPTKTRTIQAAKQSTDSLQAIPAVRILVQTPDADARNVGLRAPDLQTMIELKLRTAGMRILNSEEWKTAPRGAYILVRVTTNGAAEPFAYAVELSLKQATIVRIDSADNHVDLRTLASTWEANTRCGTANRQTIGPAVRDAISASLDEFQNAFLAANPPKSAGGRER